MKDTEDPVTRWQQDLGSFGSLKWNLVRTYFVTDSSSAVSDDLHVTMAKGGGMFSFFFGHLKLVYFTKVNLDQKMLFRKIYGDISKIR